MGCFSFMCKVTGTPALSTSFDGSPVHIFVLKAGKVIEHMYGNYDSYGRVFTKDGMDKMPPESFEWKMGWNEVCDLDFSSSKKDGIAVIHARHWKEGDPFPIEKSDNDPNQGWGDPPARGFERIEEPFHKVY